MARAPRGQSFILGVQFATGRRNGGNWADRSLNKKRRDKDLHCVTSNWGELFRGKKCPFLPSVVRAGIMFGPWAANHQILFIFIQQHYFNNSFPSLGSAAALPARFSSEKAGVTPCDPRSLSTSSYKRPNNHVPEPKTQRFPGDPASERCPLAAAGWKRRWAFPPAALRRSGGVAQASVGGQSSALVKRVGILAG